MFPYKPAMKTLTYNANVNPDHSLLVFNGDHTFVTQVLDLITKGSTFGTKNKSLTWNETDLSLWITRGSLDITSEFYSWIGGNTHRIEQLLNEMSPKYVPTSIIENQLVGSEMIKLHEKCLLVPTDKHQIT